MGVVALVVTELATNLALHTRGGVLLLRHLLHEGQSGVEVLSLDQGPGIENLNECLRDGHSTGGTSGIGLGSVRRASHVFDVHSQVGVGTALLSQIWMKPPVTREAFQSGGVSVALHGEGACGDAWASHEVRSDRLRLVVADGLGHGLLASDASRKAVEIFRKGAQQPLPEVVQSMHLALKSMRGAAVAVAEVDTSLQTLSYVGVGNISATIVRDEKRNSLVSMHGTVGAQFRKLQQFTYGWQPGALLVMHSDGVKTSWDLERYSGLRGRHPSLVAGILYRDFHRPSDDSTVMVVRESR
jgi:anti-sigma regulatory factor (Ser/Thr protein kinase)